jgi:hypothetical protein
MKPGAVTALVCGYKGPCVGCGKPNDIGLTGGNELDKGPGAIKGFCIDGVDCGIAPGYGFIAAPWFGGASPASRGLSIELGVNGCSYDDDRLVFPLVRKPPSVCARSRFGDKAGASGASKRGA